MKKILIIFTVIFGLLLNNAYAIIQKPNSQNQICNVLVNTKMYSDINFTKKLQNKDTNVLARRGCCSWHKGVCGCSGGRIICCDGTLSPSCGC